MKLFTIFLFLCISPNFSPPELSGAYISKNGPKQGYYFWDNTKEFIWFKSNNKALEIGRGTYKLMDDSIFLEFGTARKQFEVEEHSRAVSHGSESIVVTTVNEEGEPVSGLEIKLEKSDIKGVTSKEGIAILDTQNSRNKKDEVDFRIEGYRTYQKTLVLKRTRYEFKVKFDQGKIYKEHQTIAFRLKTNSNTVEFLDGKDVVSFERTTRNRYMDLYHGVKKGSPL